MPSRRSLRSLDWLNFFVATVQAGFGPFVAVYLATEAWTPMEIGQVLSLGTAAAMLSQIPGGAVVDRLRDKRIAAGGAGIAVAASAILLATMPTKPVVVLAQVLHSLASCMIAPALAAISLALVGRAELGERLGRNARFASLGTGVAAAGLGVAGTYICASAVFWLTAALMLPGLLSLRLMRRAETLPHPSFSIPSPSRRSLSRDVSILFANRGVLAFAGCVTLFQLANAALLPLVGSRLSHTNGDTANLLMAACIILPQTIVALTSPWVGRSANRIGHRTLLSLGFAVLPIRALLFSAVIDSPALLVAVQALDGLSAAVFGVMLPLVAVRLTWGTERFNLCMGVLGLALAGGATLSTLMAGVIASHLGEHAALLALAGCGAMAMLAVIVTLGKDYPSYDTEIRSLPLALRSGPG